MIAATPQHRIEAVGLPAITPRIKALSKATATFNEDDVRDYITKNGFIGGPPDPGTTIEIKTIQFITASNASEQIGREDIGRNADDLVCFVEVKGSFTLARGHIVIPQKDALKRKGGFMIFDAYTGNLLLWGA
ncbi:hypothetical protein EI42_05625 [Thermosporothrix hazakensis]|jgi:hypothetical protein|uniref:Uncharacterized protein n=1 Tax=Thermosporothrix hazakensis TaxID=644383 RepID=A0A326TZF1_THEHA|nr:hypothetical protein [Thermosporothrix hazakensis]PZW21089.1 hypothetical protein EI42_05625 [Thermosporothrix hazakensis]GCE50744.1 hypothetical protein KTH_56130 [Thermosporothrix hazakensis]